MPLTSRADLEAIQGPDDLEELLAHAGASAAAQDARLAAALNAGDILIKQFLYLPENLPDTDERWPVFHEFAVQEAFYYLHKHSRAGATPSQHAEAQLRRTDLAAMRQRKQWPGTAVGHGNVPGNERAEVVASTSRFSLRRMGGFV